MASAPVHAHVGLAAGDTDTIAAAFAQEYAGVRAAFEVRLGRPLPASTASFAMDGDRMVATVLDETERVRVCGFAAANERAGTELGRRLTAAGYTIQ